MINRHQIVLTETYPGYVNHAGHSLSRYAVIYDHGLRRSWERYANGGAILVGEDWGTVEYQDGRAVRFLPKPNPRELTVIEG